MRQALVCLAVAFAAFFALPGPAKATCRVELRTTVPVESIDGHVLVTVSINDTDATLVLDTGAERTLLSDTAVHALGLQRDEWVASTIRGVGGYEQRPNALPRSLRLGGVALRRRTVTGDTSVTVGPVPLAEIAGRPVAGLLGRDFLSPFDLDLDLPDGRLALYDVAGCEGRFLPWTMPYASIPTTSPATNALVVQVAVDGRPLRALLDSGASSSLIAAPGMYRLGLSQADLARDPAASGAGVGPNAVAMHLHRFGTLSVGGEAIRNPALWVAPVHIVPIVDMLLGADWLRTRRVWVSFASRQVFMAAR